LKRKTSSEHETPTEIQLKDEYLEEADLSKMNKQGDQSSIAGKMQQREFRCYKHTCLSYGKEVGN